MTGLWLVSIAVVTVMVASELALRGTKLQTGLARVLVVWAAVWIVALYPIDRYGHVGPATLTVFWGGAFLSWFGARSHIESSILLRMLYLLRREPMTEARLLTEYSTHYGEAMRVQELRRGAMISTTGGRTSVTPKGKWVLRIVRGLRGREGRVGTAQGERGRELPHVADAASSPSSAGPPPGSGL